MPVFDRSARLIYCKHETLLGPLDLTDEGVLSESEDLDENVAEDLALESHHSKA